MKLHSLFFLIISLWVLDVQVQANDLPRGVQFIGEVEGVSEYRLKNGLSILLVPDTSKDTLTLNVTYKVGSKHEQYGETGMAHLLEHLLFKGSKKHTDIPSEISAHGAESNGTTSYDRTNYYETLAATDANLDWALSMEADRMVNSFIAEKDLKSEMTVVRNEFEAGENNPFGVLMRSMMAASYRWHAYGKPTIGARSDIENVAIHRLQAFYQHYYQPDNAVLILAGKFDQSSTLKKIQRYFGRIPKPKRILASLYTKEPAQDGEKSVTVKRVGDTQWLAAAYHIPSGAHADYAAVEVLSNILGDTPRGRMHKQWVEHKRAVRTFAFPYALQDPGVLFFAAQVDKSQTLEALRQDFFALIEGLNKNPVTQIELDTLKRAMLKDYALAFSSTQSIALALTEYVGMGDWRLLFLTRDRIEQVTLSDIQRVAQQYLVAANRTAGYFVPTVNVERVEIPDVTNIPADLQGYKGKAMGALGEAFDPSYDNIQKRLETLSLSNGISVAVLPKKTRGETISLDLTIQYGTQKSLWNKSVVADITGTMLMLGTQNYNRLALQDALDKAGATLHVQSRATSASASLLTTREHMASALNLLAEVLQKPKFDEQELNQLKRRMQAQLEAGRQEPQAIVNLETQRFFRPWPAQHPLYEPTLDEKLKAIQAVTLKDLVQFHKDHFGGPAIQISIVGDVQTQTLIPQLQQTFEHWNSLQPYQRIPRVYVPLKQQDVSINTPDKENAALSAMSTLPIGDFHVDAPALEMANYIFGGGFLNSRLATRLRQKEGLSYSVGAWLAMSSRENFGQLGIYAIFAPQNKQAVDNAIREEWANFIAKGVTDSELTDAKSGWLAQAKMARNEDASLAGLLNSNMEIKRDMAWHQAYEAKIQALTSEHVNSAIQQHFGNLKLSFVRAGNFNKPL